MTSYRPLDGVDGLNQQSFALVSWGSKLDDWVQETDEGVRYWKRDPCDESGQPGEGDPSQPCATSTSGTKLALVASFLGL